MSAVHPFVNRIVNLFRRAKVQREIDREFATHIEMRTEDNRAAGMSPQDARRDALLRFGNRSVMRERTTEAAAALWLESLWSDVRYACRQLWKNPGFALTAIVVLALGMGASVAIFAFVDAALIKPLPYADPTRLVSVCETVASCPLCNVSYQNFRDWKLDTSIFRSLDVWGYSRYGLHTEQGIEPAQGARVSDGFFRTLGVAPILGRDFHAGEDVPGAPRTVLISYGAWQKRFGGARDVVGKAIQLDDLTYSIIGVLPRDFHFAPRGDAEFWAALNEPNSCDKRRACHGLFGLARLKDNVSMETALANVQSIAKQLELQYPDTNRDQGGTVASLTSVVVGDVRPILLVLLTGAGLLLLIATVNVAGLLLVRSENRKKEIAVRTSLGASPGRIVRQFITEGLVLTAGGSLAGVMLNSWTMHLLTSLIPANMMSRMPFWEDLGLNSHVMAFAGVIALLTAVLFSFTPTLHLSVRSASRPGRDWSRLNG